jgi:hypothetical protein
LNLLLLFILKLASVSSLLLVMDALKVYLDNLAFVSLCRLNNEGKAFCKSLVLKPDESCFLRVCRFVFGRGLTMGMWKRSYSCIKLCTELRGHSFTSSLSKDRFHN